jgi:hypothetical protein
MTEELATLCAGCGRDTTPCTHRRGCRHRGKWEDYRVKDEVWNAACRGDRFLCIGCLESRLGRTLTPSDFLPDVLVNRPGPWDTPRLAARKAGRPIEDEQRTGQRARSRGIDRARASA